MPAMHDDVLIAMCNVLEEKRDVMMRLVPFSMTHHECLSLLCPQHDAEVLIKASAYADVAAGEAWMCVQVPAYMDGVPGATVRLKMRTHAQKTPPLRPRMPAWQLPENNVQAALGERVIHWVEKRFEYGRRFGEAKHVLRELNKICTGAELRYLFPGVVHLCKMGIHPRMDTWLQKYGSFRKQSSFPTLNLPLRQATRDATALLTSVMLVGEDVPERAEGEVDITVWELPHFKFDGEWCVRL